MRGNSIPVLLVVLAAVAAVMGGMVSGCGGGGGGPSGSVEGRVVDKETGLGISGAVVRIGNKSDRTDIDGQYRVSGVSLGLQPVFVTPPPGLIVPDPDPSDPQIGDVNVLQDTTIQLRDIIAVVQQEEPPPPM